MQTIENPNNNFLSHNLQNQTDFKAIKATVIQRIKNAGNLEYSTVSERLELLEQLCQFELGRFLIENCGLNGYWTEYILYYARDNSKYSNISPLEEYMLTKCPTLVATQERCKILRQIIQTNLVDNMNIASLPCGTGHELLRYPQLEHLQNLNLFFIDMDNKILTYAKKQAQDCPMHASNSVHFVPCNAWHVDQLYKNHFDMVISNGLTIYEPDDDKILLFFKQIWNTLKTNGHFLISTLTPPSDITHLSEWNWQYINAEHINKERTIIRDIIQAKWSAFRTTSQMNNMLQQAGFTPQEIIFDKACMFPNIISIKV